jgi:excisionase family DNA binding protein
VKDTLERTRVYTLPKAQRVTGASRDLILTEIESGNLAAVRWGNRWLLSGAALETWLDSLGQGERS